MIKLDERFFLKIAIEELKNDKEYGPYIKKLEENGISMRVRGIFTDRNGNYLEDSYIKKLLTEGEE